MVNKIAVLISSLFLLFACHHQPQLANEVNYAAVIDVRTEAEWQSGHLTKANLIPWEDIVLGAEKLNLAKDQPIAVFCRSGNRAGKAKALLEAAGYTHIDNLGSLEDASLNLNLAIVE